MNTQEICCSVPAAFVLYGASGFFCALAADEETRAYPSWRPQAPELPEARPGLGLERPAIEIERPQFELPDFSDESGEATQPLRESRVKTRTRPVMVNVPDNAAQTRAAPVPLPRFDSQPVYPRNALLNRVEGHVELLFTVSATGEVTDVTITEAEPPGTFNQAVMDAILDWRFKPATDDGEPVAQRVSHRFDFNLE